MSMEALKMIYYSYVHSVISYGIIFWRNSHFRDVIFKIQKRILIVITNAGRRDSCRELYTNLQILTLPSQYIFSLTVFVNKNRRCFVPHSGVHDINIHQKYNLHLPSINLTLVQKGVLILEVKFIITCHYILKCNLKIPSFLN
jgi:hypothetical protein